MDKSKLNKRISWKDFLVGAAILIIIGLWSLSVVWGADKARIPTPVSSVTNSSADLAVVTTDSNEIELARRIIVYQTTSIIEDSVEG